MADPDYVAAWYCDRVVKVIATVGALVGFGVGLAIRCESDPALRAMAGALAGGLVGALVGFIVTRRPRAMP